MAQDTPAEPAFPEMLRGFFAALPKGQWLFFAGLAVALALHSLEQTRALALLPPLFVDLLPEPGGVFGGEGWFGIRLLAAPFYLLLFPLALSCLLLVRAAKKRRRTNPGVLQEAIAQGGLAPRSSRPATRALLTVYLIMFPFMFFYAQDERAAGFHPAIARLRIQRDLGRVQAVELTRIENMISGMAEVPENARLALEEKLAVRTDWWLDSLWLLATYELLRLLALFAGEYLVRGYLLSGVRDWNRMRAVLLATLVSVPFASLSVAPGLLLLIPGAFFLSLLAWETRSIWPGFLFLAACHLTIDLVAFFS